jgi:hypothetical protein
MDFLLQEECSQLCWFDLYSGMVKQTWKSAHLSQENIYCGNKVM